MVRPIFLVLMTLAVSNGAAQRMSVVDSLERQLSTARTDEARLTALISLSAWLEHSGPERAKAHATKAMSIAQGMKDQRRVADAMEIIGGSCTVMSDTGQALSVLKKALEQRRNEKDEVATAHCWWRLGYAYRKARRLKEAAEAYQACMSIGERLNARRTLAEGLHALSDLRQDEGRYDEMMALALRADTIYRPKRPTLTRARALGRLGNAYLSRGEPDSALAVFTRARALCVALGSDYWTAQNDLHLSYTYSDRGDYAHAGEKAQLALATFEHLGSVRDQATTAHALGYTYWGVLPDSVAYPYFQRARTLADSLGMFRQRATTEITIGKFIIGAERSFLEGIGIAYAARFDSAETWMKNALSTAEDLGDRILMGHALNGLATMENHRPDPRAAIAYHEQYLALQRTIGDARQTASALLGLGNDHLLLNDTRKALLYLDEAVRICGSLGLNELKVYVLRDLYEAHKRAGNLSQALDHLGRWKALNDSLQNNGLARQLTEQQLTAEFQKTQLADSLDHAQAIALEKQSARDALLRQRTRARFIGSGAALLVVGGGVVITLDRKRRKERFAKRALQLEMQALRAQMNPHFLFNALASINGFIGRQDPGTAKAFVARFAKLTRMVLENSRHTEVPLSRDLEAAKLYMELEQTRSGDAFDFRIELDPQVDTSEVRVPPLVLQPLVENAIWHGVANKDGRGTIIVRIGLRAGDLVVSVEDDGIGMNDRQVPMQDGTGPKSSMGTDITRSRLDLLARQKGRAATMRYVPIATGTKVELALPI